MKKSGGSVFVRSHTRGGKKVSSYTRGGRAGSSNNLKRKLSRTGNAYANGTKNPAGVTHKVTLKRTGNIKSVDRYLSSPRTKISVGPGQRSIKGSPSVRISSLIEKKSRLSKRN